MFTLKELFFISFYKVKIALLFGEKDSERFVVELFYLNSFLNFALGLIQHWQILIVLAELVT